jgi:hypothetical protein
MLISWPSLRWVGGQLSHASHKLTTRLITGRILCRFLSLACGGLVRTLARIRRALWPKCNVLRQ